MGETEIVRETNALCEVLNWTDEQAAEAEAEMARFFEGQGRLRKRLGGRFPECNPMYHGREAFGDTIRLLRRIGWGALDNTAPGGLELPAPPPLLRVIGEALMRGPLPSGVQLRLKQFQSLPSLTVSEDDARRLSLVANMSPRQFSIAVFGAESPELPTVSVTWGSQQCTSRLIWATRGLLAVLLGEAQLARCRVLRRGWPRRGTECGRAYVVKGPAGQPRKHCTDSACAGRLRRHQTEQKRRREAKRNRK